jgi:hypothetical protein
MRTFPPGGRAVAGRRVPGARVDRPGYGRQSRRARTGDLPHRGRPAHRGHDRQRHARPELVNVWNTFANTRGYAIAQLASMVDPDINKNEGLFYAVEMIIPEGSILQPAPNKPAALGSFHPAVEVGEAICIALSPILPQRSAPQVYKLGMPNAVIGFNEAGEMWMDQGVDVSASDASATQGLDGWGAMCAGLGNLILATAEDAESRFPVLNLSREMTTDTGGAGRWRGQPGTCNIKQVLEPASAMTWMVSRKHPLRGLNGGDDAAALLQYFPAGHGRGIRGRERGQRAAAGGRDHQLPVRRRRRLRGPVAARSAAGAGGCARRIRQHCGSARALRCSAERLAGQLGHRHRRRQNRAAARRELRRKRRRCAR